MCTYSFKQQNAFYVINKRCEGGDIAATLIFWHMKAAIVAKTKYIKNSIIRVNPLTQVVYFFSAMIAAFMKHKRKHFVVNIYIFVLTN